MASVCELCGKKPSFGMNLSFSHRRTKRRWNPNIQRVRALVERHPEAPQRLHLVHPRGPRHQAPALHLLGALASPRRPVAPPDVGERLAVEASARVGSATTSPIRIGSRGRLARNAAAQPRRGRGG